MLQPRDPHLDLLDDAKHAEAVAERAQRRMLVDADDADATFPSSLETLAESATAVLLETTVGRSVRGVITSVTVDHIVVVDTHVTTWVRRDGVTLVRPVAGSALRATAGHRTPVAGSELQDVLADLAVEHASIEVHLDGGALVRGVVRAVGVDVLTVRNEGSGVDALVNMPRAVLVLSGRV